MTKFPYVWDAPGLERFVREAHEEEEKEKEKGRQQQQQPAEQELRNGGSMKRRHDARRKEMELQKVRSRMKAELSEDQKRVRGGKVKKALNSVFRSMKHAMAKKI